MYFFDNCSIPSIPAIHVIAVTTDFQACIEDRTVLQIVRQCTLAATAPLTLA